MLAISASRLAKKEKNMKSRVVTFEFEKSTKGTHRYTEVEMNDEPVVAGTLYLKKNFLSAMMGTETPPPSIRVTIELDNK
jgi:hypothetical protein